MEEEVRGTLEVGEPHPSAQGALDYVTHLGYFKLNTYLEAFSSCAIEGNRLGEICSETLDRVLKGESVSDRYILGLAWAIRNMEATREAKTADLESRIIKAKLKKQKSKKKVKR